jgi:hypothetical protein
MMKKRVRIDFARPSLRRTLFHTPRAAWSVACVALGLCGAVGMAGWRHERAVAAYEAELARLRARASAPPVVQVALRPPPVPQAQAEAVNATIEQLNLPWRALHDAVQAATPPTVALLALEPDAKKHTLRITAETKGSDDMVDYVRSLQEQPGFAGVTLVRHEINDQDPNHPIRFQVDAQWRGQ